MGVARPARLLGILAIGLLGLTTACTSADAVAPGPEQAQAELPKTTVDEMSDAVGAAITATRSTGAIVGVWAPWAGTWTAGVGEASTSGSHPMTTDMSFRIGDNTVAMTCTVLLGLVDDGVVDLGDYAKTYLPRMVGIDDITLRQLCNQTSGIGNYSGALRPQFIENPTRPYAPLELITDGMGASTPGTPGEAFEPSPSGIFVLSKVIAKASGKSWPQLYEQYIFTPLGLEATSLPDADVLSLPSPHPHGYAFSLDASGAPNCEALLDESELSPTMAWTAGSMVSDLSDLRTFVGAFARGALVSPEAQKQRWRTVSMGESVPSWQAYGLGGIQLGPLRGNVGQIPGFLTAMLSDPDSGLTVVVMLNNSSAGSGAAQSLAMQLASLASKVPGKGGEVPLIALPWSAEQAAEGVQAAAICQEPATPAPAPPPAD